MAGSLSDLGFSYAGGDADVETAPATPPAPEPARAPQPAAPSITDLAARQEGELSGREQMIAAIRSALLQARRNWRAARKHEGGLVHGLEHWDPDSIAKLIRYRDMRSWVPPGHEGGAADRWGARYHTWISIPGSMPAIAWLWVIQRPFRACVAAGLTALIVGAAIAALAYYGVL
jgi:hypothetical protein